MKRRGEERDKKGGRSEKRREESEDEVKGGIKTGEEGKSKKGRRKRGKEGGVREKMGDREG